MPGERVVVGPPGNADPTGPIPPVEAMRSDIVGGPAYSMRCVLDGDDLERLQAGGAIWVTMLGVVVPFDVQVGA